jgi:hypothetical protein
VLNGRIYEKVVDTGSGPASCDASDAWSPSSSLFGENAVYDAHELGLVAGLDTLTSFPFRAIGQLKLTNPGVADSYGTGAKIGPIHILTAGHNFYDTDTHEWRLNWTRRFTPGRRGANEEPNGGPYSLPHVFFSQGFAEGQHGDEDFCVVMTHDHSEVVGLGWFGICWMSDGNADGEPFWVHGYPGEGVHCGSISPDPSGACFGYMYRALCDVNGTMGPYWTYACPTLEGMSGSPVWRHYNGDECIYAVHLHHGLALPLTSSWIAFFRTIICDFPSAHYAYPTCP